MNAFRAFFFGIFAVSTFAFFAVILLADVLVHGPKGDLLASGDEDES